MSDEKISSALGIRPLSEIDDAEKNLPLVQHTTAPYELAVVSPEYVENQPGDNFRPGTWWNAYNAVTFMADHKLGRSADTRMPSAWVGTNAKRKVKALDMAIEMAEAA